jgi:hypothetical protein
VGLTSARRHKETQETQALFEEGHCPAPDLIYAREVPDTIDLGKTNFDKKTCTLIFIEIGFSRDLGCDKKHTEKTEKYTPPPRRGPPIILGKGGIRRHPNRTRGHNANKDP